MLDNLAAEFAAFAGSPMARRAWIHSEWVAHALLLAAAIAVPASLLASRSVAWERAIRRLCSAVSSVPALAWLGVCAALLDSPLATLCFLVTWTTPPLIRGVVDGVRAVDPNLTDIAAALGLPLHARIRFVAAPLALPAVVAGLSEAVTYSSAATTVAALGGAGGFGELIVEGLVRGDPQRMLTGGLLAAGFTLVLRLVPVAGQYLMPPLWGARRLHAVLRSTAK